jgi:transposase-like protein
VIETLWISSLSSTCTLVNWSEFTCFVLFSICVSILYRSMSQLKKTARRGRIMGSWTEESMKEAIKEVKKGNDSIRKIGDRYKIPASSIRDWMSGKTSSKKKGPRTVLSKEEEDVIVEWCVANQQMNRGITFYMLRKKVADVCQGRETPFKDGIPGKRWLEWFRKRHPSVIIEPAHALKGKKRPESEKEVLVAKSKELSPSQLLVDSDRDISAMKFVNRNILGPTLDDISRLEDHESHVILTQTFNEDECVLVLTSDTMKGKFISSYVIMLFVDVKHFNYSMVNFSI